MTARQAALKILDAVIKDHTYLHLALKKVSLPELREQRLAAALVNTVLENLFRLDYVLGKFIRLKKTDPAVLNILRLGAAQILFMQGIPAHAAVSESVKLAAARPRLKGLVNAVLRRLLREKDSLTYPDLAQAPAEYLHIFYSYPLWICRRFISDYGLEEAEKLVSYQGAQDVIRIRLTDRCPNPRAYEPGIYLDDAARLHGSPRLDSREDYSDGAITAQSESSMLCVRAAHIRPPDRVLDLCAAPGGKTAYAAQLAREGHVTACDLHPHRVSLIRETAERLHLENVEAMVHDARQLRREWTGVFDIVMVDAPCSALGLLYRKPDIKIFKQEEDLYALQRIQRDILSCAARYVAPGGTLIYSTCTIDRLENEENARWFLCAHPEFAAGALGAYLPGRLGERAQGGMIQLLPPRDDIDGFFIARFEKDADTSRQG